MKGLTEVKLLTIILAGLLLLPLLCTAQDISNFYQISNFRLPALRSGQYALSLTPRYRSTPSDNNGTSALTSNSLTSSYDFSSQVNSSLFTLATAALYGISDRTTISISLEAAPSQSAGDRTSSSLSLSPQFS